MQEGSNSAGKQSSNNQPTFSVGLTNDEYKKVNRSMTRAQTEEHLRLILRANRLRSDFPLEDFTEWFNEE